MSKQMLVYRNGIPFEREKDKETGRFIKLNLPPELHKCPFCGDNVQVEAGYKGGGWSYTEPNGEYWAQCIACGARGPSMDSVQSASDEWNSVFWTTA